MSEREMLEYAARACGIDLYHWNDGTECYSSGRGFVLRNNAIWNPLGNDGDCARMEAKLGIEIKWFEYDCDASVGDEHTWRTEHYKDHNGDKQAARRLASLRVAAEIGRAM